MLLVNYNFKLQNVVIPKNDRIFSPTQISYIKFYIKIKIDHTENDENTTEHIVVTTVLMRGSIAIFKWYRQFS